MGPRVDRQPEGRLPLLSGGDSPDDEAEQGTDHQHRLDGCHPHAFFGSAEYTASKYGVAGLAQHLAWELADSNITVNTVCPGGVMTPLMEEGTTQEFREQVMKRLVPLGRYCTPEEIGEATSFLASNRAQMITGQMLAVDGGLLAGFGEDLRAVVRDRMEAMHEKSK